MTKYIFITGGVMSGLGKGMVTCSVGKMLQSRGFTVSAVKCDPYLNVDAGTMNPYIHGEVFVLDDGYEADMDLGAYERFLGIELTRLNNITSGQVYQDIIRRERQGGYLGRCVQIIPHVTDEIKRRIRLVASKTGVDVLLIESGGTVGDIEGLPFLEAFRQMRLEERRGDTLLVHVTLVPVLDAVGEPKTKPTQHSVKELRSIGLQPDVIVARCEAGPLQREQREKIALYCNVEERAVFSSINVNPIYKLPLVLEEQGMGGLLCEYLGLTRRNAEWTEWRRMVERFEAPKETVRIAMCGKYAGLADCYVSVNEALRHAAAASGCRAEISWIEAEVFEEDPSRVEILSDFDGVLVPGGFGERGTEGKIRAIEYCRTRDIPFLGICYGLQLSIVEISRHLLNLEGAHSTECDPKTPHPVIDLLPEQKGLTDIGGTMRLGSLPVRIKPGTMAHRLYGSELIHERHRHRWEVNPAYWKMLEEAGVVFSGWSPDGERIEIIELPRNLFFMATQFHPEFKSRPWSPSPPYYGFVKASLENKLKEREKGSNDK
ncbi:CTP synthase [Candidatus Bathyarchaeota archaeon]|nr:CTP synthase [Candidatus Bathyarchaeota archaeon]